MDDFKVEEVGFNLKLFKLYRFYHMLSPNSTKIFNRNAYRLTFFIFGAFVNCMVAFSAVGLFFPMDHIISAVDVFIIMVITLNFFFCSWRMYFFLSQSNKICDVLNVSRFNFFTSEHCRKHLNVLYDDRDRTIKITNYFPALSTIMMMQWIIFPLVVYFLTAPDDEHNIARYITNLRYPVTIHTYNKYYLVFYLMEISMTVFILYTLTMTDTLIMSICWVIVSQQEVLNRAFENMGHEENSQLKYYEDFKSIISDQILLNQKIKLYCSMLKPVLLTNVALSTTFFIMMTYVLIVACYSEDDPHQILTILKVGATALYIFVELFLYFYLMEQMTYKINSVNLAIYSCDWTKMDLKFKKLILLSMLMNNANSFMIKASPRKVLNLQMFANVMSTSYNILSVMLKTMNSKNQTSE